MVICYEILLMTAPATLSGKMALYVRVLAFDCAGSSEKKALIWFSPRTK